MTFFYKLNEKLAALAAKQDLHESKVAESEKWIQGAVNPANKGGLHKALHVAQDKTIPKAKIAKATHSKNPKLRHMAQFAKNVANEATDEWSDETPWTDIPKSKTGKPVNPRGEVAHMSDAAQRQSAGMTPKQKKFAKLAPPTDKITFADKIAGAKKEVDEMLGDVAAEAMKAAIGKGKQTVADEGNAFTGKLKSTPQGGKFKLGNKSFKDTSDIEEKKEPRSKGTAFDPEVISKIEKEKDPHPRHDVKDTGYSKRYTRKHEDDVEKDDDDSKSNQASKYASPKKKGRPQSAAPKDSERVTKGSYKYKAGRPAKANEEETDEGWRGGMHGERPLVKTRQKTGNTPQEQAYNEIIELLKSPTAEIDPYIRNHLMKLVRKLNVAEPVVEKAKSNAQQKFMGMVHATQKGEKAPSKEVAKVAKEMPKKAAKDFAATKHKGLPEKVKAKKEESKEEVEETTVAGSVATSTAAPKASKGGMQFGKGVYEGFNNTVERMINESVEIAETISENEGEGKTVTVTASGAEADMLMQLLKMAGLSGQSGCGCGQTPCGCEQVDENSPDWPTNTVVGGEDDPTLQTYSGGLNKPKATKQGTLTGGGLPTMSPSRQVSMEESVKLERSLFKTWKNYKG